MCHTPKVEDGVENKLFTSWTHISTLNCHTSYVITALAILPTLRARPEYQLTADIHCHKAGTKVLHEWALHLHKIK